MCLCLHIFQKVHNIYVHTYLFYFYSGGPKNYAYVTSSGKTCCKIRFSLNFKNAQILNFDSLRSLICTMEPTEKIGVVNEVKITRNAKRRKVVSKREKKIYRMIYDKRVIKDNFMTLPYRY